MKRKNETIVLILALFSALELLEIGAWLVKNFVLEETLAPPIASTTPSETTSADISAQISFGEKYLIPGKLTPTKQTGIEAIAAGKWNDAVANLQQAIAQNRNDPETLIYLNNARTAGQKSYVIATSVPIGTTPNGSLEVLRGVAQAQNEIHLTRGINDISLKVAIANDNNQEDRVKQIAEILVNNSEILGVVGHWASQVTLATAPIYNTSKYISYTPRHSAGTLCI